MNKIIRTSRKIPAVISNSIPSTGGGEKGLTQSSVLLKTEPEPHIDQKKVPNNNSNNPETFEEVIALADKMNEHILRANLVSNVHLIRFKPGTIVFQPGKNMPRAFSQELTRFLNNVTDRRWVVTVSLDEQGAETHQQQIDA